MGRFCSLASDILANAIEEARINIIYQGWLFKGGLPLHAEIFIACSCFLLHLAMVVRSNFSKGKKLCEGSVSS